MRKQILWTVLVLALVLASCTMPNSQTTPTQGADIVYTAAAQTVSAALTAAVTATSAAPSDTATPEPTPTATVTLPPAATRTVAAVLPSATTQVCNRAVFVDDITIKDGTEMEAGEEFTKTWRLKNAGSCTWTTDYSVVFTSGDKMGAASSVELDEAVGPGQTVDISVDMVAPDEAGEYTGYWSMADGNGTAFSSGAASGGTFYVQIVVETGEFAVTGVYTAVEPDSYSGECSALVITFTADITANAKGAVSYHWIFEDGSESSVKKIEFGKAGTKTVETSIEITETGTEVNGWARIYIDQPNHQQFGKASYSLTCE